MMDICIYISICMQVCIFKDTCYTPMLEINHVNMNFDYMQWIFRPGQEEVQTSEVYGADILYGSNRKMF
jgi:hypothetical protein